MAQLTQPDSENQQRVSISTNTDPLAGALSVLIVDENEDLRVYLRRCLQQFGPLFGQILEASNGLEALSVARISPVNLLICGSHLPQMSGQALCGAIRADERTASMLIMLLSDGEHSDIDGSDTSGSNLADAVLASPFNATQFGDCLGGMIRQL